jgi:hypothetical protein
MIRNKRKKTRKDSKKKWRWKHFLHLAHRIGTNTIRRSPRRKRKERQPKRREVRVVLAAGYCTAPLVSLFTPPPQQKTGCPM